MPSSPRPLNPYSAARLRDGEPGCTGLSGAASLWNAIPVPMLEKVFPEISNLDDSPTWYVDKVTLMEVVDGRAATRVVETGIGGDAVLAMAPGT